MSIPTAILDQFAPEGVVRAAINLGNPVLAQTGPDGVPRGITVDIARELARRAGLGLEMLAVNTAARTFSALAAGSVDVGFLAIEPVRAAELEFSAPYVLIEGTYMVRSDSPLAGIADFDRPGIRIAVGRGSAYHLYLERTLAHATLVAADTDERSADMFVAERLEAAAGVRQPLLAYAAAHADLRVLDGRFMEIRQAAAVPKGRVAAANWLAGVIEELKASGFVAAALARSGQDAAVAPPG